MKRLVLRNQSSPVSDCDKSLDTERIVNRFRQWAIWLVVASCAAAMPLFLVSNVTVDPGDTYVFDWLLAATLLVSRIWWERPRHYRLADALGAAAAAALGGMTCGAFAMLSLPLRYPLADGVFRSLDQAIGADTILIVTELARLGPNVFALTWPAYNFTLQLFFASLFVLSLQGKRIEAWRASTCFVATLLTVCLIAMFLPAKGAGVWGSRELFALLPDSAMRGFWAHFDEFYVGTAPVLRLRGIDGVISFPSFHTIVGLIVVCMWRKNIVTFGLAIAWFCLMLPGTLFYGGHYIVDLISGFVVWLTWFWLSRRFELKALNGFAGRLSCGATVRSQWLFNRPIDVSSDRNLALR